MATIRAAKTHGVPHAQGYARDVLVDLPALTQFHATEVSLAAFTNLKNVKIFCFTESSICRGMACAWSPARERAADPPAHSDMDLRDAG